MRVWADCGKAEWGSKPAPEGWTVSNAPLTLILSVEETIEEISFEDWTALSGPQGCPAALETLVYWAALGETVRTGSPVMYRDRVPRVLSYHGNHESIREATAKAQESIELVLRNPPIGMMTDWTPPLDIFAAFNSTAA